MQLNNKTWMKAKSPSNIGRFVFIRVIFIWGLLNTPFWVGYALNYVNGPVLSVDLFLPILVAFYSVWAAACVLVVLWAVELLVQNAATFYFHSPVDFLSSAKYANSMNVGGLVTLSVLLTASVFVAVLILYLRCGPNAGGKFSTALLSVILAAFGAAFLDVANGSAFKLWQRDGLVFPVNVAGSPLRVFLRDAFSGAPDVAPISSDLVQGRRAKVLSWASSHPDRGILYVVVESWGVDRDEQINSAFESALLKGLGNKYLLNREVVPFSGATTNGELRELCGLGGAYRMLKSTNAKLCIPNVLKSRGWETIGVHGFSESMFARNSWWEIMGLGDRYFYEQLSKMGGRFGRKCGAVFSGVCDDDVIELASRFAVRAKNFVYVLTLNSHLPASSVQSDGYEKFCSVHGLDSEVCNLNENLLRVFNSINGSLRSNTRAKLPLVVVVGDHSPPFGKFENRGRYKKSIVPAFVLFPRG